MNIYLHEFKSNIRSVIIWSLAISLLIFVFMSMFSNLAVDAELMKEMFDQFPEELLMAFGMTDLDMSTVLGFYALVFGICQLCLAIQAANYGFGLVSVEERDMTADFLLSKPIGRRKILTLKFLSAISSIVITNLIVWLSSYIFINLYKDGREYDISALLLLFLSMIILQLVFLTLGILISLLVKRVRNVTPFSMGLAFGMYILNAFGGMLGDEKLEIITPFNHFDPNYIVSNASYDFPIVWISVSFILVSVVGSYLLYSRRNIPSAV
jgi:ABC-2 type transport system permease protein